MPEKRKVPLIVSGYHIIPSGDAAAGSFSANSVVFQPKFDETWDGMVITAKFTDATALVTIDVVLTSDQNTDGIWNVPMPPEITKTDGMASLTFVGKLVDGEEVKQINTTKPFEFRIFASNAERTGDNTAPITPTDAEQLAAMIHISEAYAKGTNNGKPVESGETGYNDNAAHYAYVAEQRARAANEQAKISAEARTAAVSAAASAENAKTAAVEAKDAAASSFNAAASAAGDARQSKVDAEAYMAQAKAAAQSAKENADSVEKAKSEAVAAMGSAISARGAAEAAQSYAEKAQERAEAAADSVSDSAKLIADLAERWYDCYATEGKTGLAVHTTLGAENIPPKKILVYRQNSAAPAYNSITIRQLGKNLFDPSEDAFEVGFYIDKESGEILPNSNYACTKAFTPVLPNTDYVFSGKITGKKTANTVAFYDENGAFRERFTPQLAGGTTAFNTPAQFRTPEYCHFIRYNVSYNVYEFEAPQLEIGSVATDFESYAPEDYVIDLKDKNGYSFIAKYKSLDLLGGTGITFSGTAIRFTPPPVKTRKGVNNFFVLTGTSEEENVMYAARISATLRLDPTLVYEKLSNAVVAAGAN